jgi:hypothetical protein
MGEVKYEEKIRLCFCDIVRKEHAEDTPYCTVKQSSILDHSRAEGALVRVGVRLVVSRIVNAHLTSNPHRELVEENVATTVLVHRLERRDGVGDLAPSKHRHALSHCTYVRERQNEHQIQ